MPRFLRNSVSAYKRYKVSLETKTQVSVVMYKSSNRFDTVGIKVLARVSWYYKSTAPSLAAVNMLLGQFVFFSSTIARTGVTALVHNYRRWSRVFCIREDYAPWNSFRAALTLMTMFETWPRTVAKSMRPNMSWMMTKRSSPLVRGLRTPPVVVSVRVQR